MFWIVSVELLSIIFSTYISNNRGCSVPLLLNRRMGIVCSDCMRIAIAFRFIINRRNPIELMH